MNREISFRAWNGKQMLNWGWITAMGYISRILINENGYYTIMQYTGLTDKNGKEIYEGDIIQDTLYGADGTAEVQFIEGAFACIYTQRQGVYTVADRLGYGIEIIGNIFENADLLQGKATNQ